MRRHAAHLIDRGASTERLVAVLGIAPADAERLLRQRALLSTEVSAEEVVLRRAVGRLTGLEMMSRLLEIAGRAAPADAAVADEIERAHAVGLLTTEEHERLRRRMRAVDRGRGRAR